jgi:hypothetical protein
LCNQAFDKLTRRFRALQNLYIRRIPISATVMYQPLRQSPRIGFGKLQWSKG